MAASYPRKRIKLAYIRKYITILVSVIVLSINTVRIEALVSCNGNVGSTRIRHQLLGRKVGIFALRGGGDSTQTSAAVTDKKSTLLERLLANSSLNPLAILCAVYTMIGAPFAQYVPFLRELAKRNEKKDDTIDAETLARIEREALRREQDEEFQKSLMEDKVKEAERKRKKDEAEAAARAVAEQEQAVTSKLDAFDSDIKMKTARLTTEPAAGAGVVMLRIRCPDGLQLTRRFQADGPVESVYDFVDIERHRKAVAAAAAAGNQEALLALAEQDYTLVSTMPRLVLADRAATITAAGIKSSCALLVQPVAAA